MAAAHAAPLLPLLPDTASIAGGELALGGVSASGLAERFGTPLLVLCERTLLARADAYRRAAPESLLAASVKAFPSVAVLRLLGKRGFGADVSTLGELAYARRAGIAGARIVVHGNNKSDAELAAAAAIGARHVVLDAQDEVERAAAAGVGSVLVRVTPGIEADTHAAIRTAHHESKFGLSPDAALAAIRAARAAGLDVAGLHLHLGSQLLDTAAARTGVEWLAWFAAECRAACGWTPTVIDLGGGLGTQYVVDEPAPAIDDFVRSLLGRLAHAWAVEGLDPPQTILEPGRSLIAPAGVTLYRVGVVKRASDALTYVAVDGGMSDNPRPQLYGARYSALVANRAGEAAAGAYAICGKHCEAGDVMIERAPLPTPRRGDLIAVATTGAYTLAMASNYNAVPRPAAVLVAGGEPRLVRRRETIDDLLAAEVDEPAGGRRHTTEV
jgi:diaminopimelate decarboxylase